MNKAKLAKRIYDLGEEETELREQLSSLMQPNESVVFFTKLGPYRAQKMESLCGEPVVKILKGGV